MDRTLLVGKDPVLGELVERLAADLGEGTFELVDHWTVDQLAIALARPDDLGVLIYVALHFDDVGDVLVVSPDRYTYECECPAAAGGLGYTVACQGARASYDEVLETASRHLRPRSGPRSGPQVR